MRGLWQDIKNADPGWFLIWGLIYFGFLLGDLVFPAGFIGITALKLLGLFVCFAYAYHKSRQDHLLIIALAFTLLSDVILALNNINPWGVFVFCLVHFFHMARLIPHENRLLPSYLIGVGLIFIFGLMLRFPPIIVLGFIYAATLTSNLLLSARWHRREPASAPARRALFGFIAFLLCDACVALSYFSLIGVLPPFLHAVADYLAWAFYFPAQILICASGKSVIQ